MFVTKQLSVDLSPPLVLDQLQRGEAQGRQRPLIEIEREIGELAAHINAATCCWLELVAEFERRDGHQPYGFVACSSWLAWKCSITPRAAREQVRVARSLGELPAIRAAFRRGALSYSKVRALTRVAEPGMEVELLELGLEATAAQLERVLRSYRSATASDADAAAEARRHLSTRWEDDGTLTVRASLPADEGALLLKALDLARADLDRDARRAGGSERAGAETAPPLASGPDALVALAETAIAQGISPAGGGDRHQVIVHVDADRQGAMLPDEDCRLESGAAISAEAGRRLACDASVVTLVERGGRPLSVGRKTRSIPPSIRRALRSRDGGCCFPGCARERFVDAHHIRHWACGGETSLDNLVQLCRHHHRLVHEGGFSVARERGALTFRRPDGREIPQAPPPLDGSADRLRLGYGAAGADEHTCSPRSAGAPLDLDHAVFVFAALHGRRCRAAAC